MLDKLLHRIRHAAFARRRFRYAYVSAQEVRIWEYAPNGAHLLGTKILHNDPQQAPALWAEAVAASLAQLPEAQTQRVHILLSPQLTLTQRVDIPPQGSWKQAVGLALAREPMENPLWAAWRSEHDPRVAWVLRAHRSLIVRLIDASKRLGVEIYSVQSAAWAWLNTLLETTEPAAGAPCVLIFHENTALHCLLWDGRKLNEAITLRAPTLEDSTEPNELARLQGLWEKLCHTRQPHSALPKIYYAGPPEARAQLQQHWPIKLSLPNVFEPAPQYPCEQALRPKRTLLYGELLPPDLLELRQQRSWMGPLQKGFVAIAALSLVASLYTYCAAWRMNGAMHQLEAHIAPWLCSTASLQQALQIGEDQHQAQTHRSQVQHCRMGLVEFLSSLQAAMQPAPES
ncbi:MAG TPA: hypothetical protein PLV25_03500, partial [Opitutales bacterium]|nr:hypothetical protein [Opitutales bacterium]